MSKAVDPRLAAFLRNAPPQPPQEEVPPAPIAENAPIVENAPSSQDIPVVTRRQDAAKEQRAEMDALIGLLRSDIPDAPQRKPAGIDTDSERTLVRLVSLATGDVPLAGAFAQALEEEEDKRNLIEFQNALLQHQVEQARVELSNQNTRQAIDAVAARHRNELDAITGDAAESLGLAAHAEQIRQFNLAHKLQVDAAAEQSKMNLFSRLAPTFQAFISDPEFNDALAAKLASSGVYGDIESLKEVYKSADKAREAQAVAGSIIEVARQYLEAQGRAMAAQIMLDPSVLDAHNAQIRDIYGSLSEGARAALEKVSPYAASLGKKGIPGISGTPILRPSLSDGSDRLEPASVDIQNVIMDAETFEAGVHNLYVKAAPELKREIRVPGYPVREGSEPSAIEQLLELAGRETDAGIDFAAAARNMRALGDFGITGSLWIQGQTGFGNAFRVAYDPATGYMYQIQPEDAARMWASRDRTVTVTDRGRPLRLTAALRLLEAHVPRGQVYRIMRDEEGRPIIRNVTQAQKDVATAAAVGEEIQKLLDKRKKGK